MSLTSVFTKGLPMGGEVNTSSSKSKPFVKTEVSAHVPN
jgi:hypothetical protein